MDREPEHTGSGAGCAVRCAVCHDRPVRHSYSCTLRWADMDALAHVNNVSYADYVREARLAMLRDGVLDAGRTRVSEIAIDYLAPLVFRPEPVRVESWLDGETLVQEVVDRAENGDRRPYVRTRTTLSPANAGGETDNPAVAPAPSAHRRPLVLRRRDLGPEGVVDEVSILELFQEGRIGFLHATDVRDTGSRWVVGRSVTTLLAPVADGPGRYEVRSSVAGFSRSTFTLRAEIVDVAHDRVHAATRTTLVGFDVAAGRSRPLTDHERGRLEALAGGAG